MPNWCENDLAVEGPTEVIDEFLTFAAGESVRFIRNSSPIPRSFNGWTIAEAWLKEHAERPDYDWHHGRRTASIPGAVSGASRIGARSGSRVPSRSKGR